MLQDPPAWHELTMEKFVNLAPPFAHKPAEPQVIAGLPRSVALKMLTEPFVAADHRGARRNTRSWFPEWNALRVSQSAPGTSPPSTELLNQVPKRVGDEPYTRKRLTPVENDTVAR